jgi:glutamate-1-semialdehyde 2,1-aminomutase
MRVFAPPPVTTYAAAVASDTKLFATYFQAMLAEGIYLAPSQFEAMFVSSAHSSADIDRTIQAAATAFAKAARLM